MLRLCSQCRLELEKGAPHALCLLSLRFLFTIMACPGWEDGRSQRVVALYGTQPECGVIYESLGDQKYVVLWKNAYQVAPPDISRAMYDGI